MKNRKTSRFLLSIIFFFTASFMCVSYAQGGCNNSSGPADFQILEGGQSCCVFLEPCRVPVNQGTYTWTFSNGIVVTSTSGRNTTDAAITQCLCAGSYEVTVELVLSSGTTYTSTQSFVIPESCATNIDAGFSYKFTTFLGCPNPALCYDCELVTIQFTDMTFSNQPIIEWSWELTVYDNLGQTVYFESSSAQNPQFTIEGEDDRGYLIWNMGYTVIARLIVTDSCNFSATYEEIIKGSC